MRKLVIEKAAVKHNLSVIKERAAGAVIYGVLTGDGGGAGVVPMAKLLRAEGIGRFAVCEVKDAEKLRQAGFEDEEILMLRSTTDREELEQLVDLNVVCTVSSVDTGLALNALAENRSTVACAHIQVDTGMGFGGFLVSEPEKILLAYRSLPNVALEGIYTQLHDMKPNDPEAAHQLDQFHRVLDTIHQAGYETGTSQRRRPAGRGPGGLSHPGPVPPHPGRPAQDGGLRGGPPGRGPLAAQGPLPGHRQTHYPEKAHPDRGAPRGLPERLRGVQAPGDRLPGPVAAVAAGAEAHRPHRRPEGPGGGPHRGHRDFAQRHQHEVLRRRPGHLRHRPHLRQGVRAGIPVRGSSSVSLRLTASPKGEAKKRASKSLPL